MKLLDTDILIDHFHGHQAATNLVRDLLLQGETVCLSVVTVSEILAGLRPGEEDATESLLSLFTLAPVDEHLARIAGAYLNRFGREFRLDLGDALVAATAKVTGAELLTRNVRHYPMRDIVVRAPYERGR